MLSTSTSAINSKQITAIQNFSTFTGLKDLGIWDMENHKITVDVVFHVTKLPSPYVIYQRYQELIFASEIGPKRKCCVLIIRVFGNYVF